MELLYPDEYFLELLEEDLSDFDKDDYDNLRVDMDLNSIMDELDGEYVEGIIHI